MAEFATHYIIYDGDPMRVVANLNEFFNGTGRREQVESIIHRPRLTMIDIVCLPEAAQAFRTAGNPEGIRLMDREIKLKLRARPPEEPPVNLLK